MKTRNNAGFSLVEILAVLVIMGLLISVLAPTVLLTAMLSLVKTWNGVFMMAARMLIALTRNGLLPALFSHAPGRTTPT